MDTMKSLRWTLYSTGGILIVLGLWSLAYPIDALLSLAFALGLGFCLSGLNHLVPCLSLRGDPLYPRWFLVLGALDLILGIIMLTRLGLTAFMIPLAVSIWMGGSGLVRIATSLRLRGLKVGKLRLFPRWWLMLLSGLALVLCAGVLFASPLLAGLYVVFVLAGGLVGAGLLILLEARLIFSPKQA